LHLPGQPSPVVSLPIYPMSHTKFVAVVFLLASEVVQANQCSQDGECPSDGESQNGVSLLQTKLQTDVIEDVKKLARWSWRSHLATIMPPEPVHLNKLDITLNVLTLENTPASNKCAAAMLVILSLSLGILIWTQRDRFQNSSITELLASSCILLYIVVTISADILIRQFAGGGDTFQFSPAVITALVEVGKLIVFIVGASVDWKNTRECSLAEFGRTMQLMAIPAACFVTLNIIRYGALSGADLDQYRVWRSVDIIFVACIWFTMFKKTPSRKQIAGICLVFLSVTMMHMGHNQDNKSSGEISSVAIITIVAMALLSSLGLVLNEFGLKASTELSLFVQGIALYLLTVVFNSAVVLATVPMGQIFQGIDSPQMALIGLDVVLGVCVACVLKYADAIVKQLASGWLAPLEPLVGHFFVGTPVTPTMVFATMLAGAGSIVYRLPEKQVEEKEVVK